MPNTSTQSPAVVSTARLSVVLQRTMHEIRQAAAHAGVVPWLTVNDVALWNEVDVPRLREALSGSVPADG